MTQDISSDFKTIHTKRPPLLCTTIQNMTRDYFMYLGLNTSQDITYSTFTKIYYQQKLSQKGFNINPNFLLKLSLNECMTAANSLYVLRYCFP